MLSLNIKYVKTYDSGEKEKITCVLGRFSNTHKLRVSGKLIVSDTLSAISIKYAQYMSWNEWYTNIFLPRRKKEITQLVEEQYSEGLVTSLNGLTGDVYLLGGRGIAITMSTDNNGKKYIGLCNTMSDTTRAGQIVAQLDMAAIKRAIYYIFIYQMCIYHFMNLALNRSLAENGIYKSAVSATYGLYKRYLSLKARWNHYVFCSWLNCNVVSNGYSISIDVGVNNLTDGTVTPSVDIDITTAGTSDYMIWYGIFLEQASALNTNVNANNTANNQSSSSASACSPNYQIFRNGAVCLHLPDNYYDTVRDDEESSIQALEQEEISLYDTEEVFVNLFGRVFRPLPKNAGKDSDSSQPPATSGGSGFDKYNNPTVQFTEVPCPANITNPTACAFSPYGGSWTNGKIRINQPLGVGQSFKQTYSITKHPAVPGETENDGVINFNITCKFTYGALTATKEFKNVPCMMQRPAEKPEKDKGFKKFYILTATEDMGVYKEPELIKEEEE